MYFSTDAHLSGPSRGQRDSHPKGPNPHLALAKKKYRGNVRLTIDGLSDCKIDSVILSKGALAGALKDDEVLMWLDDIREGRYKVVKANTPLSLPDEDHDDEMNAGGADE